MGFDDRRVVVAVGSGVALLLALLLLSFCVARGHRKAPGAGAPAPHGELQVEVGKQDAKLDPGKPLRCFVGGQFVGEKTLAECAKQNGVAAQALDVGLDQTGQMAAAQAGQASLAPAAPTPAPAAPSPAAAPSPPAEVASQCLRFAGGDWRDAGSDLSLSGCARRLYDGRCVRPGEALYGRFGSQTLRLVPGKVEISNDNKTFRTLVEQAGDCALP